MTDTSNPGDTVPGGAGTTPPEGTPNANPALSLDAINQATGRNYATIEAALAAVGETYKFVATTGRAPAPAIPAAPAAPAAVAPVAPDGFVRREDYETDMFFSRNPEYAKNRSMIEDMAKARGVKPQDVVALDSYKDVATRLSRAEEAERAQSVLTSNPQLGIVRDSQEKAAEAFELAQKAKASGDTFGAYRFQREAETQAMKAVIDANPALKGNTIVD